MLSNQEFLTKEESQVIDSALLTSEEKFLTRLTISSLRLLQVIASDLKVSVNDLTTEEIIRWMENDSRVKREEGQGNGVLKW